MNLVQQTVSFKLDPSLVLLRLLWRTDPVSGLRHQLVKTEEEEKTESSDSGP